MGRSQIRYLETALAIAVVAGLTFMLRPHPEESFEALQISAVRQDLVAVVGPVWGSKESDLMLTCSKAHTLDVFLRVSPGVKPHNFWLSHLVDFIRANQPDGTLGLGAVEVVDMAWSSYEHRSLSDDGYEYSDETKRGNKFLEEMLGANKALLMLERTEGESPVSNATPLRGELALKFRKKATETDAGEPSLKAKFPELHLEPGGGMAPDHKKPNRGYIILSASVGMARDGEVRTRLLSSLDVLASGASIIIIHLPSRS